MQRREFIQQTGLATIGAISIPKVINEIFFESLTNNPKRRSLVSTFVIEDLIRLVPLDSFSNRFISAFLANDQWVHLGSGCQLSQVTLGEMLSNMRSLWIAEKDSDSAQTMLAFLAGTSLFPIIDRYIPFSYSSIQVNSSVPLLSDEAIALDVLLMKEMHNAQLSITDKLPLNQKLEGVNEDELSELFGLIRQRNLIRMHTNKPEFGNVEDWLEQILDYLDTIKIENSRYASIYSNPTQVDFDLNKFYSSEDPLIQLARGMQLGITGLSIDLDQALGYAPEQSTYCQILQTCLVKIRDWHMFLKDEKDPKNLFR